MAGSLLVVSAHAADFVWRAGGAIALAARRGDVATVICLSYGERGESARYWRKGMELDEIKRARSEEATKAAAILGADLRAMDAGDYPLEETPELLDRLVSTIRELQPTVMLTHPPADPYNTDHARASAITAKSRILAQAPGVNPGEQVIGAPPVFHFEPHQTEMCDFKPNVLLDITEVWELKRQAMEAMEGQEHLWEYYTDVAKRRGVQLRRNSGPNLGFTTNTMGEAYQRVYPQVTSVLD
jgi:4-oxalomesaconate hydratase